MQYIFILVVAIGMVVWYIRPLYNFMAKRKYHLLDIKKLSFGKKVQIALPAVIFYGLLLGVMILPSYISDLITTNETASIVAVEIMFIFAFTRYDKWQTKYTVETNGIRFRRRYISWDEKYTIQFKKTAFFVLHKPRFILKSQTTTIVVPMLSHNIKHFITRLSFKNKTLGKYAKELYENTSNYYVHNIDVEKKLNKMGK